MYFKFALVIVLSLACAAIAEDSDKELIEAINEIDSERSLPLFGGLSVEKSKTGRSTSNIESETMLDRVERYLSSHELKFTVSGGDDEANLRNGRSHTVEEERSSKLKRIILPLILLKKIKLAVLLPLAFMVLKFISLKGLAIGLLALVFSGATFFKDLLAKKRDHVTTAYITGQPINAEIVHHSDWNRNGQASAQELAYNYHTLPQTTY